MLCNHPYYGTLCNDCTRVVGYNWSWFDTWRCELERPTFGEYPPPRHRCHVLRVSLRGPGKTRLTTREGSRLQSMEVRMGGLPQSLRPCGSRRRQTGSSTNLMFLPRDRNDRREPRPQRRPATQRRPHCRSYTAVRGRPH